MRSKSGTQSSAEAHVDEIRSATRKKHRAEDRIGFVLKGLRDEYSVAGLCRREGIAQILYYKWSRDFLKAHKKRLLSWDGLPRHVEEAASRATKK